MIHDLAWNSKGSELITASGDKTARVWFVAVKDWTNEDVATQLDKTRMRCSPNINMQHGCFVYCARFHPTATAPRLAVTGGYDHHVRIWEMNKGTVLHTLKGHSARINCIEWAVNGMHFFSGDASGEVREWAAPEWSMEG